MNPYIQSTTVLQRLVDTREAIHRHGPEHFDMDSWGYTPEGIVTDPDDDELSNDLGLAQLLALDINACGTTACAAGHFVCHAQLTHEQVPDGFHDDMDLYVAKCLGVSEQLFSRCTWCHLYFDDDSAETLAERYNRYYAEHGDANLAEWMAVLDYFDFCIKVEMEASS